jgi:hypothetical protein
MTLNAQFSYVSAKIDASCAVSLSEWFNASLCLKFQKKYHADVRRFSTCSVARVLSSLVTLSFICCNDFQILARKFSTYTMWASSCIMYGFQEDPGSLI